MKVRVKVRGPHTEREYVVEAESRDAGWQHVVAHQGDLEPIRTHEHPETVYWAAEEHE
jgi:hypothetical protein